MNSLKISLGLALLTMGAAKPALAGDDDWRDRRNVSPREVARSYDRVQEERRDLARAQYRGDPRDIREESRELFRAQREFRQDRADLYRAGWTMIVAAAAGMMMTAGVARRTAAAGAPVADRPMIGAIAKMVGTARAGMPSNSIAPATTTSRATLVPMIRSGADMTTAITAGAAMAPPD